MTPTLEHGDDIAVTPIDIDESTATELADALAAVAALCAVACVSAASLVVTFVLAATHLPL